MHGDCHLEFLCSRCISRAVAVLSFLCMCVVVLLQTEDICTHVMNERRQKGHCFLIYVQTTYAKRCTAWSLHRVRIRVHPCAFMCIHVLLPVVIRDVTSIGRLR